VLERKFELLNEVINYRHEEREVESINEAKKANDISNEANKIANNANDIAGEARYIALWAFGLALFGVVFSIIKSLV